MSQNESEKHMMILSLMNYQIKHVKNQNITHFNHSFYQFACENNLSDIFPELFDLKKFLLNSGFKSSSCESISFFFKSSILTKEILELIIFIPYDLNKG